MIEIFSRHLDKKVAGLMGHIPFFLSLTSMNTTIEVNEC